MSTFENRMITCAICGTETEFHVVTSTNTFGSPDLDLRPPEMKRSTMDLWVQECPNCGYVSKSVSDKCDIEEAFLKSKEYRSCDKIWFSSNLARRFYRQYMINARTGNPEDAFYAMIHAAWACDDNKDKKNAIFCRKIAVSRGEKLMETCQGEDRDTIFVTISDLLRRSRQFNRLIKEYSGRELDEDLLNTIISFEIERARNKDCTCYTVEDAVSMDN